MNPFLHHLPLLVCQPGYFIVSSHPCFVGQPLISQSSSCSWAGGGLLCQCVVDSNPRSAVTWSVDGSNSLEGFNTSVLAQDNPLVAVLRRDMGLPLSVVCYAHNMLGNDSVVLMNRSEGEYKKNINSTSVSQFIECNPFVCSNCLIYLIYIQFSDSDVFLNAPVHLSICSLSLILM